MNREIKFRVWEGKEMLGNREALKMLWNQAQHDFYCSQPNDGKDYNGTVTWMQSVGLRDNTGKEIYEGDIVKCGKGSKTVIPLNALVCFKQQAFLLKYLPIEKKENENVYDHMEDYKYFTVLGNQFENPELSKP